jgi:hypothetical protein
MAGIAFMGVIAGHLVTDSFMTAEVAGSVLFWMVLGASAALGASNEREATPPAPRRLSAPAGPAREH